MYTCLMKMYNPAYAIHLEINFFKTIEFDIYSIIICFTV